MVKLPWVPGLRRPNFRFYRLTFTMPTQIPMGYVYLLLYASIFYIFIGGVYDVVNTPPAIGGSGNQPLIFWPGVDRQFLLEGVIAGLIMFGGGLGLFLLDYATWDPYDTKRASTYGLVGGSLAIFFYFVLVNLIRVKRGGK